MKPRPLDAHGHRKALHRHLACILYARHRALVHQRYAMRILTVVVVVSAEDRYGPQPFENVLAGLPAERVLVAEPDPAMDRTPFAQRSACCSVWPEKRDMCEEDDGLF